jgi:hypothetical protein
LTLTDSREGLSPSALAKHVSLCGELVGPAFEEVEEGHTLYVYKAVVRSWER